MGYNLNLICWLIIFQISGSVKTLTTISVVGITGASLGCDAHEFELQADATVDIDLPTYAELSRKSNVYFLITFTNNLGLSIQHILDLGHMISKVSITGMI